MPVKEKRVKVPSEVADVLRRATLDGPRLVLVGQLSPAEYRAVNKVVELLGGKWSKKEQAHVFPGPAADALADVLGGAVAVVDKKQTYQFFETPLPLAERMVALAGVGPWMITLEPSAGRGAIVRALAAVNASVVAVEIDPTHADALADAIGGLFGGQITSDFMTADIPADYFDRIVMNPPFTAGQDVEHVRRAYTLLKPGGRLVAIMSTSPWMTSKHAGVDFVAWLGEMVAAGSASVEDLPAGTFRESGTDVKAKLVCITRPMA